MKKVSKVKYCLENISYICPECHKITHDIHWIPANTKGWGSDYTNICPHCGYSFENTKLLMFPHVKQYFPDAPEALVELIDNCFITTINCNDYFGWACSDDIELEDCMITFYLALTSNEGMNPEDALNGLRQWVCGMYEMGHKRPSKALKQIRKLTGFKWYPKKEEE